MKMKRLKNISVFFFAALLWSTASWGQMACLHAGANVHWASQLLDISPSQSVSPTAMKAFLHQYLQIKLQFLNKNLRVLQKAEACYADAGTGEECTQLQEFRQNALQDLVKLARLNLALAYDINGHQDNLTRIETLNYELRNGDRFRIARWEPLTPEEKLQADQLWAATQEQVKQKIIAGTEHLRRERNLSDSMMNTLRNGLYLRTLKKVKQTFQANYESLTTSFLPLNAITGPDVSPEKVAALFAQFHEHVRRSVEQVNADIQTISTSNEPYFGHGVTMRAFQTPSLIELTLARHPEHCTAGRGLASYSQMVDIRFALVGFSSFLASPFLRPMVTMAMGVPLSAVSFTSAYSAYHRSLEEALVGVYGRDGYAFLGDLGERRSQYQMELWLSPLIVLPVAGTRAFKNLLNATQSLKLIRDLY